MSLHIIISIILLSSILFFASGMSAADAIMEGRGPFRRDAVVRAVLLAIMGYMDLCLAIMRITS